jgi:cyclopropane fatty-acyl-phospholipid synthase-like methyltransferase
VIPSTEWFEHFFDGVYARVLKAQFSPAQSQEQAILVKRLAHIRKGHHVLDVPCGLGRIAIPLAAMGLNVTGIDRTQSYLRRARNVARKAGVAVRFECRDMRLINFDRKFDAALNWFGSFGYFSDEENLAFARRIFVALKPGGRFLVEGINKSWLMRNFKLQGERTIDGVLVQNYRKWDADSDRIHDTWTMTHRDHTERYVIDMRVFDAPGIRSVLRAAGFRDIEICGHPKLTKLTPYSPRWIAVARRPAA